MIIARYLGSELLRGWLLVGTILAALFGLLALLEEIDGLANRYRFADAFAFVLQTLPLTLIKLAPVIAALGTLLAFANLARSSELVAIRAAGYSLLRVLAACALPTGALALLLAGADEYGVAPLNARAQIERSVLKSGNLDLLKGRGLWSSGDGQIINARDLRAGQLPENITLYEIGADDALQREIRAARAQPAGHRQWRLLDVQIKEWDAGRVATRHADEVVLGPFWSEDELAALGQPVSTMATGALYDYMLYLDASGQPSGAARLAFWQKIVQPFAVGAMVVLSAVIGFGLGTPRSAAFGWRILLGGALGVGYYVVTPVFHKAGEDIGLDVRLAVLLPVLLALALAFFIARSAHRAR